MLLVFGLVSKIYVYTIWNQPAFTKFYCPENYKKETDKCEYDANTSKMICMMPVYTDSAGGACIRKCPDSLFGTDWLNNEQNYLDAEFYRTTLPNYFLEKKGNDTKLCMSCPAGYGPSVDRISCVHLNKLDKYIANCDYYAANQTCEVCANGYVPKEDGSCTAFNSTLSTATSETILFCHFYDDYNICVRCRETHVLKDSQCIPIATTNCTRSDGTKCVECSSQYEVDNNTCKRKCEINEYYSLQVLKCQNCTLGCTCEHYEDRCSNCLVGYYRNGSSCLKCSDNCQQCKNDTVCTQCESGFALYKDGNSILCSNGQEKVIANCVSYGIEDSLGVCQLCVNGYYLYKNRCYYIDGCENYRILDNRTLVAEYYTLYPQEITCDCEIGKYFKRNLTATLNLGKCENCPSGTSQCVPYENGNTSEVTDSSWCKDGFFKTGNQCVNCSTGSICFQCKSETTCEVCNSRYYLDSQKQCQQCSADCVKCDNSNVCVQCADDFALYKVGEETKCTKDDTLTAPNCADAQPANSYNICTLCNVGYFLHKGRCYFIKDCGDNYQLAKVDPAHDYLAFYNTEISCSCGEKKYFRKASISGLNIGTCEKCHDGALSCVQGPNDDDMSNNASGGIVNDEKQCETKYFCNSANQCEKCTDECLKCGNNDTCSECSIGHGVNSQGKCVACHAGCTNCTDEAFDTCVACDENLTLWNNTCVVPCGAGEYNVSRPAKDGKTERLCESCTDAIRNCSVCHVEYEGGALYQKAGAKTSISCTACANNFFLKSNACIAVNDLIIEAGDDSQRVVVMRSPYFWAIVALLILFFLACIVLSIVCSLQQKRRKDEVKARIADDNFSPRPVGDNLQSGGDDDDDDAFSGSDMDAEFSADGPDTQFSDALTDVEEDALSASGFGDSQLDGL